MPCIFEVFVAVKAINPENIIPVFVDPYMHSPLAFSYVLQLADCAFYQLKEEFTSAVESMEDVVSPVGFVASECRCSTHMSAAFASFS